MALSLVAALTISFAGIVTRAPNAVAGTESDSAIAQAGKQDYLRYCAACHGLEGHGDGPVASALAPKPPDLTRIAARRNGVFPMKELAGTIDGRNQPAAHGGRDMPVWGERFVAPFADARTEELELGGRLLMLLVYLQAIQR
jgi:mono/diheme cytochrome c family protein